MHKFIKEREKRIVKAGYTGIAANILLASFKAFIGLMANSIAIVLDSINNVTDVFSSVVTIVGVKLANKPADEEHPFGHGRIEYLVTVVVAGVVLWAGIMSMYHSVLKIIEPQTTNFSNYTLIILIAAIFVKIFLSRYFFKVGNEVNSETLVVTGRDAMFDALVTTSTLIAAMAGIFFGDKIQNIPIDGILGLLISLVIIKSGVEMLLRPISELVGKTVPSDFAKSIKKEVLLFPEVKGVYDLILHSYGPNHIEGSFNIGVDCNMKASEIHSLSRKIQNQLHDKYGIQMNIGVYSINCNDDLEGTKQREIINLASSVEGVIEVHGVYIDVYENYISLDIVVDYSLKKKKEVLNKVNELIKKNFPDFVISINLEVASKVVIE